MQQLRTVLVVLSGFYWEIKRSPSSFSAAVNQALRRAQTKTHFCICKEHGDSSLCARSFLSLKQSRRWGRKGSAASLLPVVEVLHLPKNHTDFLIAPDPANISQQIAVAAKHASASLNLGFCLHDFNGFSNSSCAEGDNILPSPNPAYSIQAQLPCKHAGQS